MGAIMGKMSGMLGEPPMDPIVGTQALTATKIGTGVAYHQAAYSMELARHASYAALEMDNTSKAVQRYILGTPVLTVNDIEPTAGQVEAGGPPEYSAYPYPLGSDKWPKQYPVLPGLASAPASSLFLPPPPQPERWRAESQGDPLSPEVERDERRRRLAPAPPGSAASFL
eukprot:TRINITY_DN22615_c0_g2_i1.p1 TRINITY_DN22615_c0_g2~~TRINITY_DN22615_c0_g2_i1.p1  ORF type:complete len:189 (-),score=25.02 TRINITY_DN22615_c0_g2_i1:53-562(-)